MSYEHIHVCEDCGGYPRDLAYDDIAECTCPEDWPRADPSPKVAAFVDALEMAHAIPLPKYGYKSW